MKQRDLEDLNRLLAFYDSHKPNMKGQDVQSHMSSADIATFAKREPGGKFTFKGYTILPAAPKARRRASY